MMNWKRILNPWGEIRRLELENAALEQKCADLWDRADRAERDAFHRASEYYYRRMVSAEAQLKHMTEKMVDSANLTMPRFIIPDAPASMSGGD